MKILISGGDGFIGKNLVKSLNKLGHEIIVVDNHVTSFLCNDDLEKVIHIEKSIDSISLDEIESIDVIFHLASVASPLVYKSDFKNVYNPNVKGTEKMIELAKRDSARLIYTSTSEVYGMLNDEITQGLGISENSISISHLLTERSIYPTSKKMGEELIKNYINNGGNAVILRLFNVYGPEMDVRNNGYGRVIPNFINALRKGEEIKIFGDGNQVRSFIWIDDIIEALEKIIEIPVLPYVMNIGNSEHITISQLAELIFQIFKKSVEINHFAKDPDDPLWRQPNIDKAKLILNWEPKISLKEGLEIIIKEIKHE
jgi:nucleoside-diphosphate-sugar epimerase